MFGFGKKKIFTLKAPLSGKPVPLENVPDPAFAERLVGDGGAIEPSGDLLVAPCDGTVAVLFPTGHAVALVTVNDLEILMHIGIDTVELEGVGFEKLVKQGDKVTQGQALIRFDTNAIKAGDKPTVTPVLITNMEAIKSVGICDGEQVAGETDFMTIELA